MFRLNWPSSRAQIWLYITGPYKATVTQPVL
jgi:hypothetical protein